MAKMNENELAERNAQIVERYCTLSEQQPLATSNRIIGYLAREYNLTDAGVRHILKGAGIETCRPIDPQNVEQ